MFSQFRGLVDLQPCVWDGPIGTGMRGEAISWWLPPELEARLSVLPGSFVDIKREYGSDGDLLEVKFRCLSAEGMKMACQYLKEKRRAVLLHKSVGQIARSLDAASEKWLDSSYEPRVRAIKYIRIITGFSEQMIAHSIDLEMKSSRYRHLIQALANEIGNPSCLDDFQENPNLSGFSRAYGPGLVGAIFSSNIPALPHLEVMRAMLLKSSCIGRVSAGEPVFLALYSQTLRDVDPEIASCLAVVYWQRDELDSEAAFLGSVDYLVAYGGDEQIRRLTAAKPPTLSATWHGHKLGVAYVTRGALCASGLTELARKIAYDFSIFDGHACLCPQVCFVERGGEVSLEAFAAACAEQMKHWNVVLQARRLSISAASHKYHDREIYLMRDSMGDGVQVVEAPEDLSFIVLVEESDRLEPSPGDRLLRVVPVQDSSEVQRLLEPLADRLQCAALACGPDESVRMNGVATQLASLGMSRIVPPGIMGTPSMMWHHDGQSCLGKAVRWCDIELLLPEEVLDLNAGDELKYP
ncbi:MAG TPA: acyl-CoA reductase [Blastocatellia bacterium]|nr:acyl-CoA reductase [Blastocatellia bacterium]